MQDKKADNSSKKKPYRGNEDKNWYQKLLLSQKFKMNVVIGFILIAAGAFALAVSGSEMLHHWENQLHGGLGLLAFLGGLWFFSRGLRYESQLDAIRIAKRNRNFGGGNRKGPRKPGGNKPPAKG